ncbi:DEAD/DEAH box helicase family protein [Embleya sp. MST-111070]|uniref:DEAD/DEAH box helicase family protein n=1 Tax=Embleya sp. MST-111070 TaxID=3398231 RepID=UPI003F7345B5
MATPTPDRHQSCSLERANPRQGPPRPSIPPPRCTSTGAASARRRAGAAGRPPFAATTRPRPDHRTARPPAGRHRRRGNAFALGAARCTLVSPCGTGKTLIALGIAHRRAPHGRALVLCPTRPLLQQTAGSWYARGRPGTYVGLFSDDKPADPALQGLMTMTTDPAVLARAVRTADGPVTVFATYASLPRIIEAHLHLALPRWDIVVVDEAHRTAGALGKQWAAIHDDDAVPARHRLYLTATPRIWDVTRPLSHEPIASMDDQSLYGPVVFRYSLAQAIEEGQLADYRICAPEIHDTQLRTLLAGRPDHDDDPAAGGMRIAGAQLALLRARELHGISRTVVFSRAISHADAFADTLLDTARHAGGRHAQGLCATAVHSRHTPAERRPAWTASPARPATSPPAGTRPTWKCSATADWPSRASTSPWPTRSCSPTPSPARSTSSRAWAARCAWPRACPNARP